MIPSVLSRQLQQGIEDFLKTTFPVSTPFFHGIVDRLLSEKDGVFKGPFLSIQLPFRYGDGQRIPFPDIKIGFAPYLHQEKAFERLGGAKPRSTIVATGTGSGKTECFLYPILDYCYRHRGEPGIKAVLIYPMNALAADQAGRIARAIHRDDNLRGRITAGLFVGQREKDPHMGMGKDFIISHKDTLRHAPPDILLTNYKMLDYLLVRAGDYPLWQNNNPEVLRYLVVDELHTFDGAQGTDLACLVRRLKERLGTPQDHLCCVGTSATLGSDAERRRLIAYASEIFGEPFDADSIISESRLSAGEFLEKSLISNVSLVDPQQAAALDPENYSDYADYIRAQYELWFGRALSGDVFTSGQWRFQLPEALKGHLFFQNLLKVLGGRIRRYEDIFDDLQRVTPELRDAPHGYRVNVLNSLLALVSSAAVKNDGGAAPFLHVRHHLWLRELRRMVGRVAQPPDLRFADDLNDEQIQTHLPVVHCRECNSMGWAGLKRQHDNAVGTDLQSFYLAFFKNDPKVVFIFPEDAEPHEMQAGGQFYNICTACLHLTTQPEPGACPECNHTDLIRVFVPNSRVKRKNRQFGIHDCPYCGARNGLTILGSRAASLTSVLIAQLYTSTFNDDKKLLAFSDAVQDAAHRAGFFQGRTFRFNFRSALQQFVLRGGHGLSLADLPAAFSRFWAGRMDSDTFIASFMAPNMAWFADFETLKQSGQLPEGSTLLDDIKKRIGWEIFSEYGFRCRIGRTLEKTGSSVACADRRMLDDACEDVLLALKNEIGGLQGLDEPMVRRFILGILTHLKQQGGVWHPALNSYIESWGNSYLLNRIPWMAGFGVNARVPSFLTTKKKPRFDLLFSQHAGRKTWYESWAAKCLGPEFPLIDALIRPVYEQTLRALCTVGVLQEKQHGGERVWGISPHALTVSRDVVQFKCRRCGQDLSVAAEEGPVWDRAPCLRFNCDGVYAKVPPSIDYYGKLYAGGDIQRIFAEEHTGLLDRDVRQELEREFKAPDSERRPWYPNLLSCTPTLEMGIDIGDLSSVILCSVPPAQANYLQRIGRAGRRDGNALNLTVANARPHDLFFFAEPETMIEGEVEPPGVFLNASAVLERQYTAYCMDRWVESGIGDGALPPQLRYVLGNIGADDPRKFPYNFLAFIESHRTELFDRFITVFSKSLTQDSIDHLRQFVEGDRDSQGSLPFRIIDGLYHIFKERESLKSKVKSLGNKIRKKKANLVKDKNFEGELDELMREKNALQSLVTRINDRHTLNFLTDEGLIPNYTFPQAGVILRSIIYRRKAKTREGESRYDTFTFDYERPAVSAISELAPANSFYAGGRKVRVDQVDLSVSEIETWRFCNNCSHHILVGQELENATCPKCGSVLWGDSGQKRQMVRMRQVFASTADRRSRISDDSDDRDPAFYNKQMMVGYRETDITDAYLIDNDELPFGFEFLKKVSLREINFGEKDDMGKNVTIAGVESPRKGFIICKYCGKIQDPRTSEPQHALWCRARKKNAEKNFTDCVYLYRDFSSEAIRMLLPVTTFEGSDRKLHSFIAALHLGLKKTFSGNIDHLQTAVHEEPVPGSHFRKKYLVLYDTVPGGTGYLKQLMRSEKPLMEVFEEALATLKACRCNQDPDKDGCYQCLYAYRRSYHMGGTSRQAAVEMLSEIVRFKDQLVKIDSLKGVQVNALFDSELEARFVEALRRVRIDDIPAKLIKEVVNGKPGYFYRLPGGRAYYIEPQTMLSEADGVLVPSKADFLIRPARAQEGIKPIAVFTDGFFFHKDRIGKDMAQRCAIAASGQFHVWSLTWKDIENQYKHQGAYFHNHLSFEKPAMAVKYNSLLENYGAVKIPKLNTWTSFDWLLAFMHDPDESRWAAHAFVHCLLRLDNRRFATDEAKMKWGETMRLHMPGEVAERMDDLNGPLFYGLYEGTSNHNFMKLFVAAELSAIQQGRKESLFVAGCLLDDPSSREHAEFEAAWNGFLRTYNLLQFQPNAAFATQEGKASNQPYKKPPAGERAGMEESSRELWEEVRDLTGPELYPLLDRFCQSSLPVPEVGFELEDDEGEIIAEAELAWPASRIGLLLEAQMDSRDVFKNTGWRIHPMHEVLANPESFIDLFD